MPNQEVKYNINTIPTPEEIIDCNDLSYYINLFTREIVVSKLEVIIKNIKDNFVTNKCSCISRSNIIYQLTYSLNKEYSTSGISFINASGTIINNNFGGIPLSKETISIISNLNTNYSNICLDYKKTDRASSLSKIINTIFKSESSLVVNNIPAAIFLTLNTFLEGGNVLCSLTELESIYNEIDLESIIYKAGLNTTKFSHSSFCDIANLYKSVDPRTKAVVKITTNDSATDSAKLFAISNCAKDKGIMLFELLMSATAFDYSLCNIPFNTSVSKSLQTGVDILLVPTNKLLGGPEACIIFGNKFLIDKIKQNQFLSMFLPGNLILSSLEATFQLYFNKDKLLGDLPIFQMIKKPLKEIEIEAHQILDELKQFYKIDCGIKKSYSTIGSNLLNHIKIPTFVVCIEHKSINPEILYDKFMDNYILVKLKDNKIFIDPRCLQYKDYKILSMVFEHILS